MALVSEVAAYKRAHGIRIATPIRASLLADRRLLPGLGLPRGDRVLFACDAVERISSPLRAGFSRERGHSRGVVAGRASRQPVRPALCDIGHTCSFRVRTALRPGSRCAADVCVTASSAPMRSSRGGPQCARSAPDGRHDIKDARVRQRVDARQRGRHDPMFVPSCTRQGQRVVLVRAR